MHPLDGARAKLGWANKHFEALKTEIGDLPAETKEVRFSQRFEPNKGVIRLSVSSLPEYPAHWSLIIGDALQNFRSALNFLTWELAKWNLTQQGLGRSPHNQTQFPIVHDRTKITPVYIKDVHPIHGAVLDCLQPYGPASIERVRRHELIEMLPTNEEYLRLVAIASHPLTKLRVLSNADKHRRLHPVFTRRNLGLRLSSFNGSECEILDVSMYSRVFEVDATWAQFVVRPTGKDPKVEMNSHLTPEIAFKEFWSLEGSLTEISSEVAAIIERFEPVFS